ncbi:MAG: hypothetical protein QGH70_13325 [Nitrospinota bacterium]|jgi:MFS family permease|nr:hypothetical protein [Nitrospinota bacterium]
MSGGFSVSSGAAGLERNVRLYPWYAVAFNTFFWMPVFFLYFSAQFSLENVLRLEAVYYAAVVLLEVPSGYFSDTHGRRKTLLVSSAALVFAYALFFSEKDSPPLRRPRSSWPRGFPSTPVRTFPSITIRWPPSDAGGS